MDKDLPLVSILCTAYMHRDYIAQALDSFLMQETDFPFEILVSDDASTDGTAEIIKDYAERYPGIVRPFLMEENVFSRYGVGHIYENYLIPQSRGRFLALCEGDDYWTDPHKLQIQAQILLEHEDYSACVHNTTLHYCDGSKPDELLIPPRGDHRVGMEDLIQGPICCYHTSSLMARREVLLARPDHYKAAVAHGFADYAWGLMLGMAGSVWFIDRPMSVYRLYSGQSSWTSGVGEQYDKLRRFVRGKCELLSAFLPQAPEELRPAVEQVLLEREFELMYIEGRDREQRRGPYRELLRRQSLSYRAKNFLKSYVPGLQSWYRRRRGYVD